MDRGGSVHGVLPSGDDVTGAIKASSLSADWRRSVDWIWRQDDAVPQEDTAERAWRRLFGSDLPLGGKWGEPSGPWIAAQDEGDACTYVDHLGRVLCSSFPGNTAIGVLPRSPASDLPRVVISGGQTGADRGALDAAQEVGVPRSGWAPHGWRSEDGQIPDSYRVDLREHDSADYMARTRANVNECDGVLLVSSSGELSTGTLRTRQYADRVDKPVLHVVSSDDAGSGWGDRMVTEIIDWIRNHRVGVLMVAGPRESRDPGIAEATRRLIVEVLTKTRRWSEGGPAVRCYRCGEVMTEEGCPECPSLDENAPVDPPDPGRSSQDRLDLMAPSTLVDPPSPVPRWDPDQEAAIRLARSWMESRDPSRQVFCLFGYAGTGKTTIARHLVAESARPWLFAAYTGKAALVMRQRGCVGASTIHSLIYRPNQELAEEDRELSFHLVGDSPLRSAPGVVIDECSMVDQQVGEDVLSFGRKVLVIADPAQLPPIAGGGFFTSRVPDILLSRVHRQARESGILDLATHVREGGEIADRVGWKTADCEVVSRGSMRATEIMESMVTSDQVIVGLNRTRRKINGMYRKASGALGALPVAGDKLVCLRNQRQAGLFNGSLWRVDDSSPSQDGRTIQLELTSLDGAVGVGRVSLRSWTYHFLGRSDEIETMGSIRMAYQEFDYAYALTCHKAQGSQWDSVVLYDESGAFREHRRRWLYTGITRAARRLLVIA